ncbi:MAG: HEAT repeat domain-containing protein [Phycisphaerae bacterium]
MSVAFLYGVVLLLTSGCSGQEFKLDRTLDAAVKRIFKPRRTPQQYMIIAVSDADPDVRRDAVAKIAKSKKHDQEWAIKGFVAIALLESDPQARCVAIRALGRTRDQRAVETCLKILNYRRQPSDQVVPPDDLCRWDATEALADLAAGSLA